MTTFLHICTVLKRVQAICLKLLSKYQFVCDQNSNIYYYQYSIFTLYTKLGLPTSVHNYTYDDKGRDEGKNGREARKESNRDSNTKYYDEKGRTT